MGLAGRGLAGDAGRRIEQAERQPPGRAPLRDGGASAIELRRLDHGSLMKE